ncbi:Clp protease N-terminal domain-containing protein [Streptomyces sp. NBC_01304]|uniref:Clp protease N-terminal domain-containing protein n=1 Tax=Streptomyces sp. NBC_01304 TaxID=2903818 RepID=UPI002E0FD524|nr:peptidase [Streptomyces sp. NBC_01304]
MQSSTRPSARTGQDHPEPDAQLSAELAAVVAGARRRAVRGGDGQIDTAHLLHSLLEYEPAVRDVFSRVGGGDQVARLLGYLVQRSIGYGLRWQGTVEDSGAVPVVREAAGWSPAAASAMSAALLLARGRGDVRASGLDLLAALVRDGECRAVEVLRRGGVEAGDVVRGIAG